jgi:hypothetical protein
MIKIAKKTILELLVAGHDIARFEITPNLNAREAELMARRALGYFEAASALLHRFAELHDELIEDPLFVEARRFQRRFRL